MEPQTSQPNNSRTWMIVGGVVVAVLCAGMLLPAVGFGGMLAAIAIPNFVQMQLRSKRAEVPANVDAIQTQMFAYDAAWDGYVSAGSEAKARAAVGTELRPWRGGPDWNRLGWAPDGPVRGGYWVEATSTGFTVHGICDVDGDGRYAEYTATEGQNAMMVSHPDVY